MGPTNELTRVPTAPGKVLMPLSSTTKPSRKNRLRFRPAAESLEGRSLMTGIFPLVSTLAHGAMTDGKTVYDGAGTQETVVMTPPATKTFAYAKVTVSTGAFKQQIYSGSLGWMNDYISDFVSFNPATGTSFTTTFYTDKGFSDKYVFCYAKYQDGSTGQLQWHIVPENPIASLTTNRTKMLFGLYSGNEDFGWHAADEGTKMEARVKSSGNTSYESAFLVTLSIGSYAVVAQGNRFNWPLSQGVNANLQAADGADFYYHYVDAQPTGPGLTSVLPAQYYTPTLGTEIAFSTNIANEPTEYILDITYHVFTVSRPTNGAWIANTEQDIEYSGDAKWAGGANPTYNQYININNWDFATNPGITTLPASSSIVATGTFLSEPTWDTSTWNVDQHVNPTVNIYFQYF